MLRRRPLRENDKISTLKTIKNALNADINRSKNIDKIVKAINNLCKSSKALPALKKIIMMIISSTLILLNTIVIRHCK